jgi:hypothetical protein
MKSFYENNFAPEKRSSLLKLIILCHFEFPSEGNMIGESEVHAADTFWGVMNTSTCLGGISTSMQIALGVIIKRLISWELP